MLNPSAVLYGHHDLRIEDRPVPVPRRGEVLVAVTAIGICGSDVHYYEEGRVGDYVVSTPMILGHESAGLVSAVGDGVAAERVGQLVALEPGVPCGSCAQCRAGDYNLCDSVVFFATPPVDGSISRYVTIASEFAHHAPAGLTAEQAAMAEPVSVGIAAARRVGLSGGDRVLVTGAGPIGLFAAQVARAFGARAPLVTDLSPFRLECARRLGLRTAAAGQALLEEFDVLLECSGSPAALSAGIGSLAPRGRVALIGMGIDEVSLDVPRVQGRELLITGVFRYANTYPLALELIRDRAVLVDEIITHRFPIDQTAAALEAGRADPESLKVLVTP